MTGFGFTEAQEMLRAMARDFIRRELMSGSKERMKLSQFPKDLTKRFTDAGFLRLRIPEKYGDQVADVVTCGITCEETARPDLAPSYLILGGILAGEVVALCSEEIKAEWMPLFAKGTRAMCYSITEPDAGSDAVL